MIKKIFALTALTALMTGFSACSSDDEILEGVENESGKQYIEVVATATIDNGDLQSRTNKTPVGSALKFTWAEGDELVVIDNSGFNCGVIRLVSGADTKTANFAGRIQLNPNEDTKASLYYLGRKGDVAANRSFEIDLSSQTGAIEDITDYDIMRGSGDVTYVDGLAQLNFDLNSIMSFAHFHANMPEGVAPEAGDNITISGANVAGKVTINLANGAIEYTDGDIVVPTQWNGNEGDTYLVMAPRENVTTEFTVATAGKTYHAALPARKYTANKYFNGGSEWGKNIYFTENGEWTLNYSAEGATNVPEAQTVTGEYGLSYTFTVSTQVPVKEGYKFLGWSETANGAVNVGTTITLTQPGVTKTIYAVWEEAWHFNDYTLYLGEGGEYGSITQNYPAMQTPWEFYYDENWDSDVPELDGYEFLGWADSKNATEVDYNLNDKVTTGGKDVQTKTVYPVWKKKSSDAGVTAPVAPGTDY